MKSVKISYMSNGKKTSTTLHALICRYFLDAYHRSGAKITWNTDNFWLKRTPDRVYSNGEEIDVESDWVWSHDELAPITYKALKQLGYLSDGAKKDGIEKLMMNFIKKTIS